MNTETALHKWEHPSDYGGFNPEGDYMICGQSRDSDALERSNYRRIFADLIEKAESLGCQDKGINGEGDESDMVYDFRAGHWAVGWIEQVLICGNAPQELLDFAESIQDALSDYPVYDESDFSELEWTEAGDYWESLSISDRVEIIRDCGGNIFAARHNHVNDAADPSGSVYEYLTTP